MAIPHWGQGIVNFAKYFFDATSADSSRVCFAPSVSTLTAVGGATVSRMSIITATMIRSSGCGVGLLQYHTKKVAGNYSNYNY